jgi:Uma2 family endonuclease
MSATTKKNIFTVEEYLAGENGASIRHEYLAGTVHAMSGGSNQHNAIATNSMGFLYMQLRGKPCQPFNSDTKIRINLPDQTRFYYPDAMVVCKPNPLDDHYQEQPVVIVEVLSPSTRRIDTTEKAEAYLRLASLQVLLLVEANRPQVTVYRRDAYGKFVQSSVEGLDVVIPLSEIGADLPLAALYERVTFTDEEEE